jgi:hypothetical protein
MREAVTVLIITGLLAAACRPSTTPAPSTPALTAASEPAPLSTPTATALTVSTIEATPTTLPSTEIQAHKFGANGTAAPALETPAEGAVEPVTSPVPPPEIAGLVSRAAGEGLTEYQDEQGRVILTARYRFLDLGPAEAARLKQVLEEIYPEGSPYRETSTFPQFQFLIPGIQAGFYGLDHTLTYPQILRLKEALEVFTRPELTPLQARIFTENFSYVLTEELEADVSGLNYAGTGLVLLDRRDLFGNKYLLASVIGHEGAHILQGRAKIGFTCADALRREIGSGAIPPDFLLWKAERVISELTGGSIGAYHVSYWLLDRLGFDDLPALRQVILTGKVNGQSVVFCEPE